MQAIRRHRREIHDSEAPYQRASAVHADVEREYWKENFHSRDYIRPKHDFSDYEPAYRYGWECRAAYGDKDWEEIQDELAAGWFHFRSDCSLTWDEAAPAAKDAYDHAGKQLAVA